MKNCYNCNCSTKDLKNVNCLTIFLVKKMVYSQTSEQQPPLGPEKRGPSAEGYVKKISGKKASGWMLELQTGLC
jgi:hypothetical protein